MAKHPEDEKKTPWKWIAVAIATLVVVGAIAATLAFHVSRPPTVACIPSGDQRDINARLSRPDDVAVLCLGAVFELTAPVVFSADGQKVYTESLPTDGRRAVLRLVPGSAATAVFMMDRSDAVLSNVIVDGNRPYLGPLQGDALIQAGGSASGQVIREVRALETRSWSTIHLFEGGVPRCTGARVENNQIGPAGWTDGSWADGISLACTDSVVRNNTVIDATDGGIVIFGARGSLIERNVIRAEGRTLLGGINMVDFHPYEGDYTGTRVYRNVIDAAGAVIRIGMSMGYRVWVCLDPSQELADYTLFGAVVTENTLRGDHMQYGFAVDGVRDWTVTGNMDLATHSGTPTVPCQGRVASPPAGFQYHSARAEGTFQSEFVDADLELALWAIEEPVGQDAFKAILEDVTGSTAFRYGARDDQGHVLDTIKVIERPGGGYLGVYHSGSYDGFRVHLGTSTDLLQWTFVTTLDEGASQPTIAPLPNGGYLVAFEKETEGSHLRFAYYSDLANLFGSVPGQIFDAPRTLSPYNEGTPNVYNITMGDSIAESRIVAGFHYFDDLLGVDRVATGVLTNFAAWSTRDEAAYNAKLVSFGVNGNIGDRDNGAFFERQYVLQEAQLVAGDWSSWRVFLYDASTGAFTLVNVKTHGGSAAFANPTFTVLRSPNGVDCVVVTLFIPREGAMGGESGQLIFYTEY